MRARFFGPEASTAHVTAELVERASDEFTPRTDSTSATRRRRGAVRAPRAPTSSSSSTRPPSRRTTGRRASPTTDFWSTRSERSTCSRRRATTAPTRPFIFISTNKVYGDTPNRLPLDRARDAARAARGPRWLRRHRHVDMSIDRCTHSLFGVSKAAADLHGPGVRPLLRHADRLLPRRLPDRPPARRRAASRLPRLPDAVHRHRRALHGFGYGGKQVRDNIHAADVVRAFDAFHRAPRRAAVYNLGGGRASNCSMLEAIDAVRADRRPRARLELSDDARIGDHRWWISDLSELQGATTPAGARLRHREHPARDPRRQRRALELGDAMKLSVVIPAHNEEDSIGETVAGTRDRLAARGHRLRDRRRRRRSRRRDARRSSGVAERDPTSVFLALPNGFGFAVRAGLESSRATPWRS